MNINGKRIRTRIGLIVLVVATLGMSGYGIYKLDRSNKNKSISKNVEDDMDNIDNTNDETITYEELNQLFTNYYNNNNDEYAQTFDENLARYISVNNLTGAEIESIFGRNVPTTIELEKNLTKSFAKAFYNYTYATESSNFANFVRNEVERETISIIEQKLALINKQQMNGELNSTDIAELKGFIDKVFTNTNYSVGIKAYTANTICPAFILVVRNSKYAFTQNDAELYHNYMTNYECKVLAEQLIQNRDDSLVQHGIKNAKEIKNQAFIAELKNTITNLVTYPSTFVDMKEMKAREIVSNIVKDSQKNTGNTNQNKKEKVNSSSEKSSSKKEEVKKDQMTAKEKKQAEAGEKAIQDKNKKENEKVKNKAEDRSKKIEAAIQSVIDGIHTKKSDYIGIAEYIMVELGSDAELDKNVIANIRAKTRTILRIHDSETGYDIFDDAYALLYNEDGTMTDMMKQIVTNCIINALTEYTKKSYVTPEMAKKIEKITGIENLVKSLPFGIVQDVKTTVVPGLEGTYDPSTNYTKDAEGNKTYVNPTPTPTPAPTTVPSQDIQKEDGIIYYPIVTPPTLDFSYNTNVGIKQNVGTLLATMDMNTLLADEYGIARTKQTNYDRGIRI